MTDFSALQSRVVGPVLTPDDEGFAAEVSGFQLAFEAAPEVVVGATSPEDVAAAVSFAAENDLHITILSTGHGVHGAVGSGLMITTRRLDSLSIDADSAIATIGAGVRWGAVVEAAAPFGLAPITGSSTNVGVVGYLLGGGLGPLSRSHGFSSDYLRSVTLVTPDGELVTADADTNSDLFWALRGGKGGFGVVTSVTLKLVDLPTLYGGSLAFAEPDIEAAYRAWVDYTKVARDDVTTSAAIYHFPDIEQLPPHLRGQTLLSVRLAYPGDSATGETISTPLRAAAPIAQDALGEMPASAVATIHNDPTEPGYGWSRGALLSSIDQNFATAVLAQVGAGTHPPVLALEVRHIGSATTRDVAGGSAVGGRDSGYTLSIIGAPNPALFAEVLPAAADRIIDALDPWLSPETTINFADSSDPAQFRAAWPAETYERLESIRHRVDPKGIVAYGPHRD